MWADLGIVGMLKTPKKRLGILTFVEFQRSTGARNVKNHKESIRNTDIWDMAQKHWIVDLSKCQVILVEY